MPGTAGSAGGGGTGGTGHPIPATCAEAATAYAITASPLEGGLAPYLVTRGWGAELFTQMPVAVTQDGVTVVGFTHDQGGTLSAVIVSEPAGAVAPITIPDAVLAGLAATSDGLAVLLFDPAPLGERRWAQVRRFGTDGSERFATDLFRSPNLEDEGTRGEPGTGRLAYVQGSDTLIAYFGHTRRARDGVRHQGGYVASISPGGEQTVLDDWFGSHNLDQRILVTGARAAVLGLGDAYPKGIFFSYTDDLRTDVIYRIAVDGVGGANARLGGMVELGSDVSVPFLTNLTISQDLDAGEWPDTDEVISEQIREAADNARNIGMLRLQNGTAVGEQAPVWLEPMRGSELGLDARLESLKSARYGTGDQILLAWAESVGDSRNPTRAHYTMVIDGEGAVCQSKARLADELAFTSGDDILRRPDGSIVWANAASGAVQLVTLTP